VRKHAVVHSNDKLALKVNKVGKHLFENGKIDKQQFESTKKFGHENAGGILHHLSGRIVLPQAG